MKRLIFLGAALCGLSLLLFSAACGGRPAAWDGALYARRSKADVDPSDPSGTLQVRGLTAPSLCSTAAETK